MKSHVSTPKSSRRRVKFEKRKRCSRFLNNALGFIERDISIFPVAASDKFPITKRGFKDATTDAKQIRKWAREFPNANIGIKTGSASSLVFIDLDRKNGVDGVKAIETPCNQWKIKLPKTYWVQTPSRGKHIFFRSPKYAGKIPIGVNVLAMGIDIRAEGGCVVAQGSSIDGANYKVIEGDLDNIAILPRRLRLKT